MFVGPQDRPALHKKKKKKEFMFKDTYENWKPLLGERITSFTHSSSFIGNVIYDSELQEMSIILSGKTYVFCNVSDRLFDAFEGATSKGSFFNREIKSLHDC